MRRPNSLRAIATLCVAAVLASSPAAAQATEEERALGFVRAVAAGDADALLSYMELNFAPELWERRPPDGWKMLASMLAGRHAGLEIQTIDAFQPHQFEIGVASGEMELQFTLDFEPEPPHRIAGLGVRAGGGGHGGGPELPPFELPEGAGPEEITAALEEYFDDLGERDLFSGTALVAVSGEPIFQGAWGLASIEWNVANRIDTRFDLGSINKSFTRIAVGQLLAAGKLSLDDTVADHLPGYPNPEVARRITIRQLLDHSSGLGDIFNERFFNSSRALYRSPSDFFPVFADEPLLFEPGTSRQYSNAGYMVLGAIIEAVAETDYYSYVEKHVFGPAGMTQTGFFAHDEPEPNVAVGYTRMQPDGSSGPLRNNLFKLPIKGNSAGSAQSTVGDMLRFDNALREHRLLPPAYTGWQFGGAEPEPGGASATEAPRATAAIGIAGGAPGVSSVLESDGSIAVIVLSNRDEPGAESVARRIYRPLARALAN